MNPHWTPRELDQLQSLAGDYPFPLIVSYFQAWATQAGLPVRSRASIDQKLRRLKCSRTPVGIYVTAATIVEMLGVTYTTLDRWVHRGYLKVSRSEYTDTRAKREAPPRRYFTREAIKAFAKKYPELFGGVSRQNLFLLLEDEKLADFIVENYPWRRGRPVPVRCVQTGRCFNSMSEAAKYVYVTKNCLEQAVREGHRAGGYNWQRITPTKNHHDHGSI